MSKSFINSQQIEHWLEEARDTSPSHLHDILAKARQAEGLSPSEVAALLYVTGREQLEQLFDSARHVKERIYGKRVVLFAPLYISNECTNNCLYCGFRHSNQGLERRTLTMDEIREQVLILEEMGHKRILLESGEDLTKAPINYVLDAIETIYSTRSGNDCIRRVNVNVAATTVANYRLLKQAGIGTYQLFQESYHAPTYSLMHPSGPKANYLYHLTAMDRAMQGGIDDVGIGALFGLYDHRYEVMAMLQHIEHLQQEFGVGPHTISVPRLRPVPGSRLPQIYPLTDSEFKRMVAILRLAVPYTGIILSTRERAALRDELLDLGVSQMSAASATSPGGYRRESGDSEQFTTADQRSLHDVVLNICRRGYLPSFCTSCYRVGRTGEHFMEMAKDGEIQRFCQPNAILTLAEYLCDHNCNGLREQLAPHFAEWLRQIPDDHLRALTEEKLARIGNKGERDIYL